MPVVSLVRNIQMRDYYDIYVLLKEKQDYIQCEVLKSAFEATCKRRNSITAVTQASEVLNIVKESETMKKQWETYRNGSYYVGALKWIEVFSGTERLAEMLHII